MNIVLVCSAGMSTSMLVKKMKQAAKEVDLDVTIHASPEVELDNHLDHTDVILIGPQVRYLASKIKAKAEPLGIQVDVINPADYGMMNGEKVFAHAQALLAKK